MTDTLMTFGAGPGISQAVAARFAQHGFQVALVARDAAKLSKQVAELDRQGTRALSIAADAGDPEAVQRAIKEAEGRFGPITVLHWNVATPVAGDLLVAPVEELRKVLDVGAVGLVTAVQAVLPGMRNNPKAAVLVTNGGFGVFADPVDAYAVSSKSMGLAVANSAKHKVSRLLSKRLAGEGVYLGEVMVTATVKGTAWDQGQATLEAAAVADRFWAMYQGRSESLAQVG